MTSTTLLNANPTVHETSVHGQRTASPQDTDESVVDAIDAREIFDMLRTINDPEHPLNVVRCEHISVDPSRQSIRVEFTPTIPHCSMATLIGLSLRVKLLRSLPIRYKVDVLVRQGTHQSEEAVNKQLNDKERVAAALENQNLLEVVNQCLATSVQ